MDDILKKFGVKFEDLNTVERDTLLGWVEAMNQNKLTLSTVKEYISRMKDSVAEQLADEPEFERVLIFSFPNRKQILLKARLRNYILFESLLESPERAKKAVEKAVANIKTK